MNSFAHFKIFPNLTLDNNFVYIRLRNILQRDLYLGLDMLGLYSGFSQNNDSETVLSRISGIDFK